ncbi:MAG: LysE/ArgO family amino acid transporter [Boseongicola sp.]
MFLIQDALAGFALGLSLIIAIGAQNIFVLQQGLMRSHVLVVCTTCAVSDAVLISIGVGGFQLIAKSAAWIEPLLTSAGAIFLFIYGATSARISIWPGDTAKIGNLVSKPLASVVITCLAITWLNPHVYLDTVVFLGAISTQYGSRLSFGIGAVAASFFFFLTLGYGAQRLSHYFESRFAWRILDAIVALIMWTIAFRLFLR